jgi:hypothetical protein
MPARRWANRWAVTLGLTLVLGGAGFAAEPSEGTTPGFLQRPVESPVAEAKPPEEKPAEQKDPDTRPTGANDQFYWTPMAPTLGFAGPTGIAPRETQSSDDFIPIEDRWRYGFPAWDRYAWGFPLGIDYPYKEGHYWDPYNQNVLKGDYPILGQNTFFQIIAADRLILEYRSIPTPAVVFEDTARAGQHDFFGRPNSFVYNNYFNLTLDLFHGDTLAFKPIDWRVKVTPVFNINSANFEELGIVSPNTLSGTQRARTFFSLEEYLIETKLCDLSPDYDFMSVRIGSQFFNSDFRGFNFSDTNRAVRLFGTRFSNRDQFNILYFRQAEKDTNSELNTFDDRGQDIFIANYYRQDFIWPGYTAQWSVHFNHDDSSFHFNKNGFLVRPDPAGVFQPHTVDAVYLGWAGDGHINRFNITHQLYWVFGQDSHNPISGCPNTINAQMFALELSYDRDWARFRGSFFWASGDDNPNNSHATGFDTIFDSPNFAGGPFSYWQRQAIGLFGVNLKQRESLVPDLRSSKTEGQSNFVNPGLFLANMGFDVDITPKIRFINNLNLLWFDETAVLQQFVFQGNIHHFIGTDISSGFEYRPLLNNNIIINSGAAMLAPGQGFRDLYNPFRKNVGLLGQIFTEITLLY